MSERILKALMQLFSIVSEAEDISVNSRKIVETFLNQQLNQQLVDEYLVLYDEYISAGYLMVGKKFKKFSAQLGVRTEFTEIKTALVTTNEVNNRDYLNFFPSAHFSYQLKKEF